MNNQVQEIKLCPSENCPLFKYRFGKNPAYKGSITGNPEALKKAREALKKKQRGNRRIHRHPSKNSVSGRFVELI